MYARFHSDGTSGSGGSGECGPDDDVEGKESMGPMAAPQLSNDECRRRDGCCCESPVGFEDEEEEDAVAAESPTGGVGERRGGEEAEAETDSPRADVETP